MKFSNDWFEDFKPHLKNILKTQNVNAILEIGTFEGAFPCWALENYPHIDFYCIDSWENSNGYQENIDRVYKTFCENTKNLRKNLNLTVLKKDSRDGLLDLSEDHIEYFDLIYIDGSHKPDIVLSDAVLSYHLLKTGGIMIFDDYLWVDGYREHSISYSPKLAVDSFVNSYFNKLEILSQYDAGRIYVRKK
jgi:predicted O-methyltransferase YrrM